MTALLLVGAYLIGVVAPFVLVSAALLAAYQEPRKRTSRRPRPNRRSAR